MINSYMWDEVYWLLYDKLEILSDSPSNYIRMFTEPVGSGAGKGIEATDLYQSERLEDPCQMLINGFTLVCCPTSNKEVYHKFIERYAVDIWIGHKTYMKAPGALFPHNGTPESIAEALKELTKLEVKSEGNPTKGFIEWPKGQELMLPQGMLLTVTLSSGAPPYLDGPLSIYAVLWGTMRRGVQ